MSYFESRLKVNVYDLDEIQRKLEFCEKLGIQNIILEPINDLKKLLEIWKKGKLQTTKINIFFRLNLIPQSLNELKSLIKNYNKFPFILSVESLDKQVQIHAARDSRVDILSFSNQNILKSLTSGVISLIKQNNSFIEFSLDSIMIRNKAIQSRNLRNLYKFMHQALNTNANYIISGNFTELFDLRHPRSLVSICNSILEIPLDKAIKGFKNNPILLIERVQKRKDESIIESGVKLIEEGEYK